MNKRPTDVENAEYFYQSFKNALNFVGVGFSGMNDAVVYIEGNHFCVSANGLSARISFDDLKNND